MNTNFDLFKQAKKWFLPTNATTEIIQENTPLILSDEYKHTFPSFTKLVSLAEITLLKINEESYRLFAWTNKDNQKFGWLADTISDPLQQATLSYAQSYPSKVDFRKEHLLLVENIGGIVECWNEPDDRDFLTWAKNFIFRLHSCYKINRQDEVYDGWISDPVEQPLDISKLLCFSEEANGNMTFYNTETGEIFLFMHDHCFDYVTPVEGHPEDSFYRIDGIKNFIDYSELLAKQFLENIL